MILAHAGHWVINLLYSLPALVMGLVVVLQRVRERRAERLAGGGGADDGV